MRLFVFVTLFELCFCPTCAIAAQVVKNQDVRKAADNGLLFLQKCQNADGSFGRVGESYGRDSGVAALCGLAFLSGGSTSNSGPHSESVTKIVRFLVNRCDEKGFLNHGSTARPMYGHGFATQFLAESYGMLDEEKISKADVQKTIQKSIQLIIDTQNREIATGTDREGGGWRYEPVKEVAADISVTVTQIMALRSAKNAGFYVPKETIDRGIRFIEECRNADGGFMYMLPQGPSAFARSAAAVAALQSAGVYESKSLHDSFAYLTPFGMDGVTQQLSQRKRDPEYFFYGHYYSAIALWVAGSDSPLDWKAWYNGICHRLLAEQRPDGSWVSTRNEMPMDCATAMGCFILNVPQRKVPMLLR